MDKDKLFLTPSEGHPSPWTPSGRMTPVNIFQPTQLWSSTGWTPPAYCSGHEFGHGFVSTTGTISTPSNLAHAYGPPSDIGVMSSYGSLGPEAGAHPTPYYAGSENFGAQITSASASANVLMEDTKPAAVRVKIQKNVPTMTAGTKKEGSKSKAKVKLIRNPYKKAKKVAAKPAPTTPTRGKKAPRLPTTPKVSRMVTAEGLGSAKHTQVKNVRSDARADNKPRRISREAFMVACGGQFATVDHYKPSPARHTRSKTHATPLSTRRFERSVAGKSYYDVVPAETTPRPIMKAPPPTPHGTASTAGPKKKAAPKSSKAPIRRLTIHSSPGSSVSSHNSTATIALSVGSIISVTSAQSFAEGIVKSCVDQIVPKMESLIQDSIEEVWRASK
jgi:hypothetical protein